MRIFACGELGWSLDKWRHSTLPEYIMAVDGYWRNWERSTAWLMREIVFEMINGNPHIKGTKPASPKEIYKIKDDEKKDNTEYKKPSAEELEEARQMLIGIRDRKK
jgi:hypothetical protein